MEKVLKIKLMLQQKLTINDKFGKINKDIYVKNVKK